MSNTPRPPTGQDTPPAPSRSETAEPAEPAVSPSNEPATEVTNLAEKLVEVHEWLRGQLDRVRVEAEEHLARRTTTDAPVGLGLQIRQHCLAFCESLHFHHTNEDTMFPKLAEGYPHLREPIERLMAEHRVVDRIRGELERLLADLPNADPEHFRAELDRMSTELHAHLEFEERTLLPTLSEIPFPPPTPGQED